MQRTKKESNRLGDPPAPVPDESPAGEVLLEREDRIGEREEELGFLRKERGLGRERWEVLERERVGVKRLEMSEYAAIRPATAAVRRLTCFCSASIYVQD